MAEEILNNLKKMPKDTIVPRRRPPTSANTEKLSPEMKASHKSKNKANYAKLNAYLKQVENDEVRGKVSWENPAFQDEDGQ
jgi:hypothetical protein